MSFKAAIFDMDGVVVDTVHVHFNAWKRMFAEYGHDFTFDEYKEKVDGIPRVSGVKAILKDLSDEEVAEAGDKKQRYFIEELKSSDIPIYQTTLDLIEELKRNKIKVAVISASKNAPYILKKIGLLDKLDAMVSGDDVSKGKPDPEVFLKAASKLQVDDKECVVFEDAVLGVEAAGRAFMVSVGIDRYDEPARLSHANIVVNDLGEINYNKLLEFFK